MSRELRADEVWKACDPKAFPFRSTAELRPEPRVIGQPRGLRAIELGIAMDSPGYNIYVLGDPGTGRTTAAQAYIEGRARQLPVPPEWVYLFHFADPHRPRALKLMPGKAARLRQGMDQLVEDLQKELPRALESDAFRQAAQGIRESLDAQREQELGRLQTLGREKGAAVVPSPEGLQILPAREGRPLTPEELAGVGEAEQKTWRENSLAVQRELEAALRRVRHVESNAQRDLAEMIRRAAAAVLDRELDDLRTEFSDQTDVLDHMNQVRADILDNVELFRGQGETGSEAAGALRLIPAPPAADPLRRYRINVLVDHTSAHGAPVVVERHPSVPRLLGRIEHETRFGGGVSTDFTLIRPGALHRANGGFLIVWARDLFAEPGAWDSLERALASEQFAPDDPAARSGAPTSSLHPESVPLDVKVILIGSPSLYYFLVEADEDFRSIFKVMADFDESMERTSESELAYAEFIAGRCQAEGLLPLAAEGVARVVEEGSRLAGTQRKLSTRFGTVADLVREADHWARSAGRKVVDAHDVGRAVRERRFLRDRAEEQLREDILTAKLLINVEGEVVGQVNALTVASVGDHTFGHPTRVTARTYAGKEGVVQIDREVELAGPIHNKGVLTLIGYLGGRYADEHPLSLSAHISFEQNYGGLEGDSAASTELFALLSSLAEVPSRQWIAVTGSVNQQGQIQAVGSATEKVEGWYALCAARGLTGEQGVILPASNIPDLMLEEEIRRALEEHRFHVWAIDAVDDGLPILTGRSAKEIHRRVKDRLRKLAQLAEPPLPRAKPAARSRRRPRAARRR